MTDLIGVSAQPATAVLAAEVWLQTGSETLQVPMETRWSESAVLYRAKTSQETAVVPSVPASGKTEAAWFLVVLETLAPKTVN